MKSLFFRFCAAFGIAVSLLVVAVPANAEKHVALVVGNNDYLNVPKLRTAVNDARTMSDTLKQLGFTVMFAENQTRVAFTQTLLAFEKAVGPGDTAFFFYAGHGFEIAGQNFLLPTDVPPATEGQEELVRDASVLADRIVERLQNRKVRTTILVLDACRNNPFERSGTRAVAGSGGLAPMVQLPEGVFSIFSAGPRQTALDLLSIDDNNPNSVFTRTFSKQLSEPGLSLVQVAQRTRRLVGELAQTVRHKQIPVYFDQMVDDVFLNGRAAGTAEAAVPPVRPVEPPRRITAPVNAPIAAFSRSNSDWTVRFSFPNPTLGISWRLGQTGPFRETGFMDEFDPQTRKRTPNPLIQLPAEASASTIQVRYVDTLGEIQGPFSIKFDPEFELIRDQRKNLELNASDWLQFGQFNNEPVVFLGLIITWHCAVRDVRVGIDSAMPDRILRMPACNFKDPIGIPEGVQSYLKLPPETKSVSVELTYRDGSVSEIKSFRR